ncbi:related to amino acid permease (Dip5) [Phialocephala subalpina]|uniref:Related to amino acid permease (Dip5) n=1 Tax=Phialocephala subalpina TaxID=576137 RepID=A0A1L7XBE5_9HELO|nr:related to amino acid permease (Dip5) [Phialocephala subalpina]
MESRRESPNTLSTKREKASPERPAALPNSNQDHEAGSTNIDQLHALKHKLTARHLSMIALGGALGTGLIIGTGPALARGGPAAILIMYALLGFAILQWALLLAIASLILQYWVSRTQTNPGVWIAIFLVVIVIFNFFGVKFFGELEFYLSALKIVIVVGLLILSVVLVSGGGPNHDAIGFRYWSNPGAFNHFIQEGTTSQFFASIAVLVNATYAYLGTELIAITFGEAENPRRNIPRAIRLTFYRITLITANSKSTSASASPFTVAIHNAGISILPGIFNGCVLVFIFSAANSNLYIASRTIYGLSVEGLAPSILSRTNNNGVPVCALLLSSVFGCLAFLNVSDSSAAVFQYFVNVVTIFGILTWMSLLITHIFFVRARKALLIPNSTMAYTAPFGLWGTYFALFVCTIIAFFKNFSVFVKSSATGGDYGAFDYKSFITGYIGIPVYAILFVGFKVFNKTEFRRPGTTDLYTGKQEIDD